MRVCVFGGTFDPIHNGHIECAKAVMKELQVDRIILLPAGIPPHKNQTCEPLDRLNMVRLACRDHTDLTVSDLEIRRKGTSYTVDTMRELTLLKPEDEFFFLIGADVVQTLDHWVGIDELTKLCTFAVVERPGAEVDEAVLETLKDKHGARFVRMNYTGREISSAAVREQIGKGETVSDKVPVSVSAYIKENGLYITGMSRNAIITQLRSVLKPSRFEHTLGVAETAKRLAIKYGADPQRAEYAGLLHDCAKYMPAAEMRELLAESELKEDEQELSAESVLHAPAGAILAHEKYGVKDESVLSAIRKHTIGDSEMSLLDAIIYTADFIEPGRAKFDGLEKARELTETDIWKGMVKCAELTRDFLKSKGTQAHPKTLMLIKNYKIKQ